ncbi:SDR family NAD(P)-dependent oxidoreductase [Rhodohalobacter sp. 8-1]|uniref:SDR family NAD(P)-dependent oxidoreductase n=1 Tax=Rhodohalobacter sp. 8-1 TaxID=3131972 RepID=UPI0030EE4A90
MSETKTVLLTGCTRGIGLEIASLCLRKGWRVIGTARKSSFPENLKSSDLFQGIHADLEDIPSLKSSIYNLISEHQPDVLVNNAGIFIDSDFESDDDSWLNTWDKTMTVNLKSAALLSKWFLQMHLQHETKGIIINIASRASYRGDTQEYAAYAASKAGMVALTKSMARDFSKRGVVAYSIAPGFIETDMAKDAVETLGKDYITRDSVFEDITQPNEVAEMVAFLASGNVPHATGQTFHVNGGSYMI